MLTKDLVKYRIVKGIVKPRFIKTADPDLLCTANQLLSLYRNENHPSRGEIEESAASIINASRDVIFCKGLNKLLLDRCEFSHGDAMDYPAMRRSVLQVSARLLKENCDMAYQDFLDGMAEAGVLTPGLRDSGIYADLPENEKLNSFKDLYPGQLLERYNCSLVQFHLLTADSLVLSVFDPEPAKMRRLFKYLKFFRLLARIFPEKERPGNKGKSDMGQAVRITIDGPMSLFENTRRYGLQLASFFPAVCGMSRWKLEAEVRCKSRRVVLKLDEKSKLTSHYHHFGSYVPEEISMFHRLFKEKVKDWTIIGHSSFLDVGNQELIFPDLSFRNSAGKVIHLELFHRWHAGRLPVRLGLGEDRPDVPLLIGVDRSLYKKPDIKESLDSSPWFESNGFLFRDFPGVATVVKCLERLGGG